jgi:hypothetical protein
VAQGGTSLSYGLGSRFDSARRDSFGDRPTAGRGSLKPDIWVQILVPEPRRGGLAGEGRSLTRSCCRVRSPGLAPIHAGAERCGSPGLSDTQLASVQLRAAPPTSEASELVNTPV